MATDKQIAANRINAQRSSGPTSKAGKAISSQNATKTGIDAKSEIIRLENPADHAELVAAFQTRFAPATPEEQSLVDALIRFEWFSRRYACIDTAIFENRFYQLDSRDLGQVYMEQADKICRALRAFTSVRRGFNASLKQLNQLQAKRLAEAPPVPAEANILLDTEPEPDPTKSASFLKFPNPKPEPPANTAPQPENLMELPQPEPESPPKAA
jgi:hypothetical protein